MACNKGRRFVSIVLLLGSCVLGTDSQNCEKTHPKVGLTADLETLFHEVTGTVEVIDDCTFQVHDFTYDGTGPDVFWYLADTKANLDRGFISDAIPRSHGPWDGTEEVMVKLPKDVTWDDVNAVSVWCRAFGIDFGSTVLPAAQEKQPSSGSNTGVIVEAPGTGTPNQEPSDRKSNDSGNAPKDGESENNGYMLGAGPMHVLMVMVVWGILFSFL